MTNPKQHRRAASTALAFIVVLGLGILTTQSVQAQTFTVLYNFTGGSDGGYPYAGLVRDAAGNLYGTASNRGVLADCVWKSKIVSRGCGTVFELDTTGKETTLYGFTGGTGDSPQAGLVRDTVGNLYGTTSSGGGTGCGFFHLGCGVVFKIDTSGTETVLYRFTGSSDGRYPEGLVRDKAGNLYGTTLDGGDLSACFGDGCGTVFKLDTSGTETVLYSFTGSSDGAHPEAGVIMDAKGNLYGVTNEGGGSGGGTVYELSKSGTLTVLHSFAGGTTDGCTPYGGLLRDKAGNLYGTTVVCGASGEGTVFKIDTGGTEIVLHSFAGGTTDGANPYAGVIVDAKGNLYGDTRNGGTSGLGTVYELNTNGTLILLHSFARSDGELPYRGVIRDVKGNFYGTALAGGSDDYGTVWKLTP